MIIRLAGRSAGGASDGTTIKAELLRICATVPKLLVLDLSDLMEINSAVLGALLLCLRLIAFSGGTLRLAGVQPAVLSVLRHSKLLALFECKPDVQAALL